MISDELAQNNVRSVFGRHVLDAAIAQRRHVDPIENPLSSPEQYRRQSEVHFIDQAGPKVRPECGDTTSPRSPEIRGRQNRCRYRLLRRPDRTSLEMFWWQTIDNVKLSTRSLDMISLS
jgi:hypothetical protein